MAHQKNNRQVPTLIPYFTVQSTSEAIQFYERAFGFQWDNVSEASSSGEVEHVEMSYKDILIMFSLEGAFGSPLKAPMSLKMEMPLTLYIYCDDVDALYRQAKAAGAQVLMEPNDAFWGDRVFQVQDRDGYRWMFAAPLES
jgi:uncharacterized glyoxalase superfamily protein PhnB